MDFCVNPNSCYTCLPIVLSSQLLLSDPEYSQQMARSEYFFSCSNLCPDSAEEIALRNIFWGAKFDSSFFGKQKSYVFWEITAISNSHLFICGEFFGLKSILLSVVGFLCSPVSSPCSTCKETQTISYSWLAIRRVFKSPPHLSILVSQVYWLTC